MAQRLVRRICADCIAAYQPEDSEFPPDFGSRQGLAFHRGSGCRECRNTGFKGRLGIYELLTMTEAIRELVIEQANAGRIEAAALQSGHLTLLRQAVFAMVRSGQTTIAEVLRATKA